MIKTIFRTFLLGLGIGVLVAPRPGSETRQMLSERFTRLFNTENGASSTSEWDRPLDTSGSTSMTPSQHYVDSAVSSPTTSGTTSTSTTSATNGGVGTRIADSDIAGATEI